MKYEKERKRKKYEQEIIQFFSFTSRQLTLGHLIDCIVFFSQPHSLFAKCMSCHVISYFVVHFFRCTLFFSIFHRIWCHRLVLIKIYCAKTNRQKISQFIFIGGVAVFLVSIPHLLTCVTQYKYIFDVHSSCVLLLLYVSVHPATVTLMYSDGQTLFFALVVCVYTFICINFSLAFTEFDANKTSNVCRDVDRRPTKMHATRFTSYRQ